MARTIAAIKQEMTDAYAANTTVRAKYGLADGEDLVNKIKRQSIWLSNRLGGIG